MNNNQKVFEKYIFKQTFSLEDFFSFLAGVLAGVEMSLVSFLAFLRGEGEASGSLTISTSPPPRLSLSSFSRVNDLAKYGMNP